VNGQNGNMQHFIQQHGYTALFLLAIVESMCVPIPSEVTFAFGGAMCASAFAHHPLSLAVVIVLGTVGSLIGSVISYEVGRYAGRPLVDRFGKYILLTHKDLDTAEKWFARFGDVSVLVGRIVPVVRTVISLPAGLAKMRRGHFMVLTTVGAAVWVGVLSGIGYALGSNWNHVAKTVHVIQYPVLAVIAVLAVWGFWHRLQAVRSQQAR
jgi:membrane protein DedA with SNARE-associated domain